MGKIDFDPTSPIIEVDITLEGEGDTKRRIKVALDTGATYTMIPWEILEALGYKPEASKERVTLITASGVETAPVIEINKINFLNESLDNVPVVCHDLPSKSYVTGLLGASFLRHFKVMIDYLNGTLEISYQFSVLKIVKKYGQKGCHSCGSRNPGLIFLFLDSRFHGNDRKSEPSKNLVSKS